MTDYSNDDMVDTLATIARREKKPIAQQIVDIQKGMMEELETMEFLKNLHCFEYEPFNAEKHRVPDRRMHTANYSSQHDTPKAVLRHRQIDGRKGTYTALSWTWKERGLSGDDRDLEGYAYEKPFNEGAYQDGQLVLQWSDVRNPVLRRVWKFMEYEGSDLLWIDKLSVNQTNGEEKQAGIRAMHLVYSYSKHPVALLARPVKTTRELDLLCHIMSGSLSTDRVFDRKIAWESLQLLEAITKDLWWSRAWTFQENYRGLKRMILLMPCAQDVTLQEIHRKIFGKVDGELCIRAREFSTQATKLCKAYECGVVLGDYEIQTIQHIRSTAGKYTELLSSSDPMFATVIADIAKRAIDMPWDRLDITANCCWYPIRLNTLTLRNSGASLSLSLLTLCILNGEIIIGTRNAERNSTHDGDLLDLKVVDLIQRMSFRGHISPIDKPHLTFNRGCRYPSVICRPEGVVTDGHLWILGPEIDCGMMRRRVHCTDNGVWLTNEQRQDLIVFNALLKDRYEARPLVSMIDRLLHRDKKKHLSFSDKFPLEMAGELMTRIWLGDKLRLAKRWEPGMSEDEARSEPFRAVFLSTKVSGECQALVFTALRGLSRAREAGRSDDERHVSVTVRHNDTSDWDHELVPHLSVEKSTLGFCNFQKCPKASVLFPWPQDFHKVDV